MASYHRRNHRLTVGHLTLLSTVIISVISLTASTIIKNSNKTISSSSSSATTTQSSAASNVIEDPITFEAAFQGSCESKEHNLCQHDCYDLHDGTFECGCKPQFTLHDNGYSCIENRLLDSLSESSGSKKSSDIELTVNGIKVVPQRTRKRKSRRRKEDITDIVQETMVKHSEVSSSSSSWSPRHDSSGNFNSCLEIECEAGGTCISDPVSDERYRTSHPYEASNIPRGRSIRCRCPLGRTGQFCEKPSEVRFPRFRGNSYLALPTLHESRHEPMEILIEFKPEHFEGLLLYSGAKQDLEGDFIALLLNQGYVEFRFDCGLGEGVVKSEKQVILNSWNRVTIYRDGWTSWMTLNDGLQSYGQSQGLYTHITFQLELFLGGSPNLTLVSDRTNSFTGLTGCVRKLVINGKDFDFRSDNRGDAIDGIDIEECASDSCSSISCQNGGHCITISPDREGICLCPLGFGGSKCQHDSSFQIPNFNGSSYLQLPGLSKQFINSDPNYDIEMVIKPMALNGLILYNGQSMDGGGSFIAINLVDGLIEYRFDVGNGPSVIRSIETIQLNKWSTIKVSRTSRLGTLIVNEQPEVGAYNDNGRNDDIEGLKLSLPLNLFIGGVPDIRRDVSKDAQVASNFVGCIQRMVINGKLITINNKNNQQLHGVNIDECPHICTSTTTSKPTKFSSSFGSDADNFDDADDRDNNNHNNGGGDDHGEVGPCSVKGATCEPIKDSFICHCPDGHTTHHGTDCNQRHKHHDLKKKTEINTPTKKKKKMPSAASLWTPLWYLRPTPLPTSKYHSSHHVEEYGHETSVSSSSNNIKKSRTRRRS